MSTIGDNKDTLKFAGDYQLDVCTLVSYRKAADAQDQAVRVNVLPQVLTISYGGVYIAYVYYYSLFKKIKKTHCDIILSQRVRISNKRKYGLFLSSFVRHTINWI